MDIVAGIRAHLLGDATISAAVGTRRIYTPILPEKLELSAIKLLLVSDVDGMHLRGPNNLPTDRIQVDVYATTRDAATALGRLCRQRLNGYSGVWFGTGSPPDTLTIQLIRHDVDSDRFDEDILGGVCWHSADYMVTFSDSSEQVLI